MSELEILNIATNFSGEKEEIQSLYGKYEEAKAEVLSNFDSSKEKFIDSHNKLRTSGLALAGAVKAKMLKAWQYEPKQLRNTAISFALIENDDRLLYNFLNEFEEVMSQEVICQS